jgi:hydroxypyruvate reductase
LKDGLLVTKYGHVDHKKWPSPPWEVIEAGHPLPDKGSLFAGSRLIEFLQADTSTPILFLISGGASSLVEYPVDGVDETFLSRMNAWLLGSGLDIGSMNRVRKGMSRIKGGGLLRWTGERPLRVLAISDVPGDDPGTIGSGLLTPESGHLPRLDVLPDWLRQPLEQEQDKQQDMSGIAPEVEIVANLKLAKEAAADEARRLGYRVFVSDAFIDGDAAECGRRLAGSLMQSEAGISIWGGETGVRLPESPGRGGRNQHLALAAAIEMQGMAHVWLLSAGTDCTDGPTEDAGALVDGSTLERAEVDGFDGPMSLLKADAGSLLEASGDLVTTGPTGTNVMDLIIGLKS